MRGFRVELGEIEERLRAHPAVADAAVVAVDDGWQTSLRGFVVLREPVPESALKQHLRQALPEHEVPGRILALDELPLTPNGKLDRAWLAGPEADPGQGRAATSSRAPPTEQTLARIWREVLGKDRIGVHDNFFALGGNSIHFVEVLAKSRAAGLDFTFRSCSAPRASPRWPQSIEADSADEQADVAARGGFGPFELILAEDRALLPADAEDAYPLSMLQAGLIFQTEITGGLGQYHDVLSYSITGTFDASAFTEAVRLLSLRHPILRTSYHLTGYSEFLQVVHRQVPRHCRWQTFAQLDPRPRRPGTSSGWRPRRPAGSTGSGASWSRCTCRSSPTSEYRYTVSQHNSALDGWSISLLHTQLFGLYYQLRDRQSDGAANAESADAGGQVDNHLRNFIGLEREALRSSESRDFWLRVLDGSESTNVPRRPGAEDTDDFQVMMRDVPLPAGLTQRVSALADSLSVPFKDVLLAAHLKVLWLVSGQPEVTTGYEHSGRPELPGAETTLGLHLNSLPLRSADGLSPAGRGLLPIVLGGADPPGVPGRAGPAAAPPLPDGQDEAGPGHPAGAVRHHLQLHPLLPDEESPAAAGVLAAADPGRLRDRVRLPDRVLPALLRRRAAAVPALPQPSLRPGADRPDRRVLRPGAGTDGRRARGLARRPVAAGRRGRGPDRCGRRPPGATNPAEPARRQHRTAG